MVGRRVPIVTVGLASLGVAVWNLASRDLAGDEINMLHGSPAQILQWSLDIRSGFTGHLPWSFWLRWASLSLFSEATVWAWRVHAVLGTVLATVLTANIAQRERGTGGAWVAGALMALHPVLAFHAQDASNYAWSATTGALAIDGVLCLERRPSRGAWTLGLAVLLGAANDFYSVLWMIPIGLYIAFLAWKEVALRGPLVRTAIAISVVLAPFVAYFAFQLWTASGTGLLDVHADPLSPRPWPAFVDAPWRVARRVFGAFLHGYDGGRDDTLWIAAPPILVALFAARAAVHARMFGVAMMLLGPVLLHGIAGIGLQLLDARVLPHEPRALIAIAPAFALALSIWSETLRGRVALLTVAFPMATALLQARLQPADLRAQAINHVARIALPNDIIVIPDVWARGEISAVACAPRTATAIVWVSDHRAEMDQLPWCDLPGPHLFLHLRHQFDAPTYEGSAASFLPRRVVSRWSTQPPKTVDTNLVLVRHLLDGLDDVTYHLTDAQGATLFAGTALPHPLPRQPAVLHAQPAADERIPQHTLFSPFRNEVAQWDIDPMGFPTVIHGQPLAAPWLTVLRRISVLLAVLLGALVPRRTR